MHPATPINPYNTEIVLYNETKGFFQLENVLLVMSFFRFTMFTTGGSMLWVYSHYKYFTLSVLGPTPKVGPHTIRFEEFTSMLFQNILVTVI